MTTVQKAGTTVAPFDAAATSYDADFTDTPLGRLLRAAVWARLDRLFAPRSHILELNCGTGEDALWLARRGHTVVATDASPAMLAAAQAKAARAGVGGRVALALLDLARVSERAIDGAPFDGVLSNFGGLNCLSDWRPLAAALAQWVRPGGRLALVLMGPWCLWEIVWYLGHGQPRTALRRLRRGGVAAHAGRGQSVHICYPSSQRLAADFAPWFRPLATVGIGALLPPSYLGHLVDRWPRLFAALARAEARIAAHPPARWVNDHYLLELERGRA